ncbi:response regulator [Salipiger mucosus]|uniref:Multisensor signal transduction histidine kinase n=1 Tax=Salipiger mucosus DSM 16094 TaxID=1123237 RepID=S9S7G9_9RHOB|nr:response regulator [Salipiger mucosus]EPX82164.1 multisensor signal transduction histidine kinase [Salipiger mucosus DSM 16094]
MGTGPSVCLIVEDTETDRAMMRRIFLRQWPKIPLVFATTLSEARRVLGEERVAMIFLDNALPDGRGADFAAELAAAPAYRRLPVVVVSDWPSPFMYAKARAANVIEIWTKSDFTPPSVQRVVRQHVGIA